MFLILIEVTDMMSKKLDKLIKDCEEKLKELGNLRDKLDNLLTEVEALKNDSENAQFNLNEAKCALVNARDDLSKYI